MSRQAAHVPPGLTGRDLIWDAMRENRTFTVDDLAKQTRLKRGSVDDYVQALVKAGIVAKTGSKPTPLGNAGAFPRAEYTVVPVAMGIEAPRVRKNGTLIPPTGRQRMWRIMPILKDFSIRDLASTASLPEAPVSPHEAQYYVDWLARAGYLRSSGAGRWTIVPAMRRGPRAPQIQRIRRLLDPNTGEIMCETEPVEERAK